jgi:hypothetical protein
MEHGDAQGAGLVSPLTMKPAEGPHLSIQSGDETASLVAVPCDKHLIGADGPRGCLHGAATQIFDVG